MRRFDTLYLLSRLMIYFSHFIFFFAFFNAKLINHIILSRNVLFLKFFGGIRGFLIFDMGPKNVGKLQFTTHPQEAVVSS